MEALIEVLSPNGLVFLAAAVLFASSSILRLIPFLRKRTMTREEWLRFESEEHRTHEKILEGLRKIDKLLEDVEEMRRELR